MNFCTAYAYALFYLILIIFLKLTAKYEFKLTISKGNFDNARQQCASLGGDLITVNLGPKGKQYSK